MRTFSDASTFSAMGHDGILHRARDRRNGRLMQDNIHAVHGATCDVEIGKVAFHEIDAGEMREVSARAGDKVIDDTDLLAAADEFFRQVGPE